MTVACKLKQCPFNDKETFCLNPLPALDENGHCSFVWRKGQSIPLDTNVEQYKIKINIVEGTIDDK